MPDSTSTFIADSLDRVPSLVNSAAASRNRSTASGVLRSAKPEAIAAGFFLVLIPTVSVPRAILSTTRVDELACWAKSLAMETYRLRGKDLNLRPPGYEP